MVAGYALLGATWLAMKTDGAVAERARGQAKVMLIAVLAFMGVVSLWTPLAFERIAAALVLHAQHLLPVAGPAASPR